MPKTSPAEALCKLQDIDLEIIRLKGSLDELPEKQLILEVRKQRSLIEQKREQAISIKSSITGEIEKAESDTTALNEGIEGLQDQLKLSPDHRSVEAITHEMDSFKKQIEKIEYSEIALMEKKESIENALAQIDQALQASEEKEKGLIDIYTGKGGTITSTIEELIEQRKELVSSIAPDTLANYVELLKTKRNIAVAKLVNESCSVCRMTLSEGQLDKVLASEGISVCPSCHRILITE